MDRLRQLLLKLRGEVCFWICERLDDKVARPTVTTRRIVGDALSMCEWLDLDQALKQAPDLPPPIIQALGKFSRDDWAEVGAFANLRDMEITPLLKEPEWAHLRRKPID